MSEESKEKEKSSSSSEPEPEGSNDKKVNLADLSPNELLLKGNFKVFALCLLA
jgi:hypothetical protein